MRYLWPQDQIPRSSQNKVFMARIIVSSHWQKLDVHFVSFAQVHDKQAVSHHSSCPSKLRVGLRFGAYIGGGLVTRLGKYVHRTDSHINIPDGEFAAVKSIYSTVTTNVVHLNSASRLGIPWLDSDFNNADESRFTHQRNLPSMLSCSGRNIVLST